MQSVIGVIIAEFHSGVLVLELEKIRGFGILSAFLSSVGALTLIRDPVGKQLVLSGLGSATSSFQRRQVKTFPYILFLLQ